MNIINYGIVDSISNLSYPTSGLCYRWTFDSSLIDEITGLTLNRFLSSVGYSSGKVNNAVYCSIFGNLSILQSQDSNLLSKLNGTNKYTISYWVFVDKTHASQSEANFMIGSDYLSSIQIYNDTTNVHFCDREGGDNTGMTYNTGWYHFVLRYDGSYSRFFINTTSVYYVYNPSSYTTLNMIQLSCGYYSRFDQFYIYNRDLSDSEILQLYNGGMGI